jgi:hypothetical protein
VILFPAGLTLVVAWVVFHDPAFDYRLAAVGALVPVIVDAPFGRAWFGHTLLASLLVLAGVMLATRQRRAVRRHAIAIPIGMLLGLVASAMWTQPKVLWWPAFGPHVPHVALFPPGAIALAEELAGAIALVWFVRRFELRDPRHLRTWLRTGRVPHARMP